MAFTLLPFREAFEQSNFEENKLIFFPPLGATLNLMCIVQNTVGVLFHPALRENDRTFYKS